MRTKPTFESRLAQARAFVELHGEFPVISKRRPFEDTVNRFLGRQRQLRRTGELSRRRCAALNKAVPGWTLTPRSHPAHDPFVSKLRRLEAFVAEHGRRPRRAVDRSNEERRLAEFVEQSYTPEKRDAIRRVLRDIPYVTPPQNLPATDFEVRFEQYRQFVALASHVPRDDSENEAERQLAHWANKARVTPAHRSAFATAGAVRRSKVRDARLEQLRQFIAENHRLPETRQASTTEEASLAKWLRSARRHPSHGPIVDGAVAVMLGD